MSKMTFLRQHVDSLITLAAPPKHDDVSYFVREAFKKARQDLLKTDDVGVRPRKGYGTGFTIDVFTGNKRPLRFKAMMRLRAYMNQFFEVKDMTVVPGVHNGKPVMEYRFHIMRVKKSRKPEPKDK